MKKTVNLSFVTLILLLSIVGCSKDDGVITKELTKLEQSAIFDFSKGTKDAEFAKKEVNKITAFSSGKENVEYGEWVNSRSDKTKGLLLFRDYSLTLDLSKVSGFKEIESKYKLNGSAQIQFNFLDHNKKEINTIVWQPDLIDGIITKKMMIPLATKTIVVTSNEGLLESITIFPQS